MQVHKTSEVIPMEPVSSDLFIVFEQHVVNYFDLSSTCSNFPSVTILLYEDADIFIVSDFHLICKCFCVSNSGCCSGVYAVLYVHVGRVISRFILCTLYCQLDWWKCLEYCLRTNDRCKLHNVSDCTIFFLCEMKNKECIMLIN